MMFWSEPLKVVLATVHVPLRTVPRVLTREVMDGTIDLDGARAAAFRRSPRPRLARRRPESSCGRRRACSATKSARDPPAVDAARARGIQIEGPFPGDTVFVRATKGEFDAVIACYHDQGLIPVKLLAFGHSVNVTLGLPIIRTSVDHGTAFDIAGKNVADPTSLIEATLLAARLASGSR